MKVLVINCGSSSLKYQFIDMENELILGKGLIERIGLDEDMPDHKTAIQKVFDNLHEEKIISQIQDIDAVGHRFVNGGEKFIAPTYLDDVAIEGLDEIIVFAPLHNPAHIAGIKACRSLMPKVPQVAVFDTAFHQTMPEKEFIYAIPYDYYEKYSIRRFGAHGTSHKYVSIKATEYLGKEESKIITCHMGNGSSISAVKDGKCIATSMGFTPLGGVIMGTRCGDIDPAVATYIMEKEDLSIEQLNNLLNKKSGVLGVSGVSSDFRDIQKAAEKGNHRAKLALEMFYQSVKKYIGSYVALLGGLDALVFTAGIGENSPEIRAAICQNLNGLGIEIDLAKNKIKKETEINIESSKVKILVIPTNEELMIARETIEVLS